MQKMGVKVYEIAPADHLRVVLVVDLALALFIPVLRRLSEYLAGHEKALSIVRIPLAAGGGAAGPGAAA
jgi:hypothetical protein